MESKVHNVKNTDIDILIFSLLYPISKVLFNFDVDVITLNFILSIHFRNLLLPEGIYSERQKASYIFDVYRCLNLLEKPTITVKDTDDNFESDNKRGPNTYVEITFAGVSVSIQNSYIKYYDLVELDQVN